MIDSTHPTDAAEFLSRLHDGELSPAERSAFESHLAGCEACRRAVAEFERSLAAFRSAPTAPVPTDLSARILRKIRAQSPSRRPFGVMFGIDIRWAGVFLAALLVAIIAPALFSRRSLQPPPASPDAIPAYVVETGPGQQTAAPEKPRPEAQAAQKAPETRAPAKAEADRRVPEPEAAAAPAPVQSAADELERKAPPAREVADSAPPTLSQRGATPTERSGGEAAGAIAGAESATERVHLEVLALDGVGPPAISEAPADERLAGLRGREFILIVEPDGYVRGVTPAEKANEPALREKDGATRAQAQADRSDEVLRQLRFEPAGRPRRLLVRVR